MLLQIAAARPFPGPLEPADVASLGVPGAAVRADADIDWDSTTLCKTLARLRADGRRRMEVLPASSRLRVDDDFRLAPEPRLVELFGFARGALGPVGAHGAAAIRVEKSLVGKTIAVGCGRAGTSLVVGADALVAFVGGEFVDLV